MSIAEVARHAGVSRKFIYSHPDLRADFELDAAKVTARQTSSLTATHVSAPPRCAPTSRTSARSRTACANRSPRSSVDSPKSLGQQIAGELPGNDLVEAADRELADRLERAEQRAFELQESTAAAREELAAVREINRELLAAHNRFGG